MVFEKFVPPRKVKPDQVSIKRAGTISFDVTVAAAYGLTKASHAVLYFDPSKKLVGVRPTRDPKDEGAMKLTHRKRVTSLRARAFFEAYGIRIDRAAHYPVRRDKDSGMAVVSLADLKRRRGPRKRRA